MLPGARPRANGFAFDHAPASLIFTSLGDCRAGSMRQFVNRTIARKIDRDDRLKRSTGGRKSTAGLK
jgi:hypothetical protein